MATNTSITVTVDPLRVDEAKRIVDESIMPMAKKQNGFVDATSAMYDHSSQVLTANIEWSNEQNRQAFEATQSFKSQLKMLKDLSSSQTRKP
jgi:uncharacterized membrane protein YgcG